MFGIQWIMLVFVLSLQCILLLRRILFSVIFLFELDAHIAIVQSARLD